MKHTIKLIFSFLPFISLTISSKINTIKADPINFPSINKNIDACILQQVDKPQAINVMPLDKNIIWKVINSADELTSTKKIAKGDYTVGIYMAADNDLFPFAGRNIRQMQNVGSNERLKIVIHFDIQRLDRKKICKRLFIEHNKIIQIGPDDSMDSGNKDTLINFCSWMIEKFPSENYIIILWNHGTGIIEPALKKAINPAELFHFNPATRLIELNRTLGFFDYINLSQNSGLTSTKKTASGHASEPTPSRGICFDDTTNHYLTNKDLKEALKFVCENYLNGKKINILACDACFMSMLEVVSPLKDYVQYFVASQEVELGTGYDYSVVLEPFKSFSPTNIEFAKHLVTSFSQTYGKITHDYTHSAFDLNNISNLETDISKLANALIFGLQNQKNRTVKEVIRLSKHKNFCTYFDEPSYIDLGHFFINLIYNINKAILNDPQDTIKFQTEVTQILKDGLEHIGNIIIANTAGGNLKAAMGTSIYFPEYHIHSSYNLSEFAHKTNWINFLSAYIRS